MKQLRRLKTPNAYNLDPQKVNSMDRVCYEKNHKVQSIKSPRKIAFTHFPIQVILREQEYNLEIARELRIVELRPKTYREVFDKTGHAPPSVVVTCWEGVSIS